MESCQNLCVHVFTGAVQIDEAEEDQMASASPRQPDPRESAAAEADEEGSDTEPPQVTCRTLNPTLNHYSFALQSSPHALAHLSSVETRPCTA